MEQKQFLEAVKLTGSPVCPDLEAWRRRASLCKRQYSPTEVLQLIELEVP